MMFTSMAAEVRHKDPLPYRIAETGERVTDAAFGTPGVTIYFDPRPEFMPASKLTENVILAGFRNYYTTDTWASSMIWLTSVAAWTKKIFGAVPKEWRTDLPSSTWGLEVIAELVDEVGETTILPQLIHAGNVLQRLADCSEANGKAYPLERHGEH